MNNIKLRSCDGETIEVERDLVKTFGTLTLMFKNCPTPTTDEDHVVPLPNVNAVTLRRVLKWVEYHQGDPIPNSNEDSNTAPQIGTRFTALSAWDQDFFTISHSELFALILAADYLDIKDLMDHSCQFVANMMSGKSPDQIREMFKIKP